MFTFSHEDIVTDPLPIFRCPGNAFILRSGQLMRHSVRYFPPRSALSRCARCPAPRLGRSDMRLHLALLAALALYSRTAYCQPDDEDEGYGGEDGSMDEGGYGGEDEDAPPPPAGDARELTSVEEFELFLDDNDASVIGAFLTKEMPDPSAVKPEGWDDEEPQP